MAHTKKETKTNQPHRPARQIKIAARKRARVEGRGKGEGGQKQACAAVAASGLSNATKILPTNSSAGREGSLFPEADRVTGARHRAGHHRRSSLTAGGPIAASHRSNTIRET
jgi:hypothetical protein